MWLRLWRTSPELMVTAALMAVVLAGALAGLAIDSRVITGAPAWLKPAKFAISIAIYTVTLAWIFSLLPERPRLRSCNSPRARQPRRPRMGPRFCGLGCVRRPTAWAMTARFQVRRCVYGTVRS